MGDLFKNQRNLFVAIFSGITLMVSIWYYGFHQSLASAQGHDTQLRSRLRDDKAGAL